MKTYLAYKSQIQGYADVSETVKTVEKIAASSMHSLKQEMASLTKHSSLVEGALARLSSHYHDDSHPFLQRRRGAKMIVILTGDKGLVGGLWHDVVNAVLENVDRYKYIIVVGSMGDRYLKEERVQIVKKDSERIANYIFNEFQKEALSCVDILYPRFISLAEYVPRLVTFLPFQFKLGNDGGGLPIFEQSRRKVFNKFLLKYIEVSFHKIIAETKLSELSARTVAMEHATIKTRELVRKLTLDYTKQRRRVITQGQLESFTAHKMI